MTTKISTYLDDGRVFEYQVDSPEKAREHSHAIIMTGYRHTADGVMEHCISKVKCVGGVETSYPDKVRGT